MIISLVCTLLFWLSISPHPDNRLYSSCSQQGAWTGDKPGLLDLLRRWYALLGARQTGTPPRGTNTRHCTTLNVLWCWHLLRHRATIHHRAAWKWPSPLHGQYVYSFLLLVEGQSEHIQYFECKIIVFSFVISFWYLIICKKE